MNVRVDLRQQEGRRTTKQASVAQCIESDLIHDCFHSIMVAAKFSGFRVKVDYLIQGKIVQWDFTDKWAKDNEN